MNENLKPCPFCGEIPISGIEYYDGGSGDNIRLRAVVYCKGCGANKSAIFRATDINLVPFLNYEAAYDKAKKLWNKRSYEVETNGDKD